MIDIHSHFLFGVDDGSPDIDSSVSMLKRAYEDGVTDVICTPHFRKNVFEPSKELIEKNFALLKAANPYPVNLYLGQEIAKFGQMFSKLKAGELLTINGTKYVLLEFKYIEDGDIEETVYDALYSGFKPIIAHVERYEYVKPKNIEKMIDAGALIQVNADSLVLKRGAAFKKRVERYLKEGLVHFVANDMHYSREYCMKKAYDYVFQKFDRETADDLFKENGKILIK